MDQQQREEMRLTVARSKCVISMLSAVRHEYVSSRAAGQEVILSKVPTDLNNASQAHQFIAHQLSDEDLEREMRIPVFAAVLAGLVRMLRKTDIKALREPDTYDQQMTVFLFCASSPLLTSLPEVSKSLQMMANDESVTEGFWAFYRSASLEVKTAVLFELCALYLTGIEDMFSDPDINENIDVDDMLQRVSQQIMLMEVQTFQ